MFQITAPAGTIAHGPDTVFHDNPLWWVDGDCYTDNSAHLDYFRRRGFTVTDVPDPAPQAYLDAVAAFLPQETDHGRGRRDAVALQDAAEPNRRNYT